MAKYGGRKYHATVRNLTWWARIAEADMVHDEDAYGRMMAIKDKVREENINRGIQTIDSYPKDYLFYVTGKCDPLIISSLSSDFLDRRRKR